MTAEELVAVLVAEGWTYETEEPVTEQERIAERQIMAGMLISELTGMCPDSQVDPENARANVTGRAALRVAWERLQHIAWGTVSDRWQDGYRNGSIEMAIAVIDRIETEMYDPRSYPERYTRT